MDIYKNEDGYHFGNHKISLEPKIEEITPIIEEYKKKIKPDYSFIEYLSDKPMLAISYFSFIFCIIPLLTLYSLDFLSFSNLEYGLSLGDNEIFSSINRTIVFTVVSISILILCDISYYFSFKSDRSQKNKDIKNRISYFEKKKNEIKRNPQNHPINFFNVPDGRYIAPHQSEGILAILLFSFQFVVFFFSLIFANVDYKKINIEGEFNSVHYIDDQYVIFQNKGYKIEKIKFPKNIKVNINISPLNNFESEWVEYDLLSSSYRLNPNIKNHLTINISEDNYIKGSLIGH